MGYMKVSHPNWPVTHARMQSVGPRALGASFCGEVDTDQEGTVSAPLREAEMVSCVKCSDMLREQRRQGIKRDILDAKAGPRGEFKPLQSADSADYSVRIETLHLELDIPCGKEIGAARRCFREVVDQMIDSTNQGTFLLTREETVIDIVHLAQNGRRYCLGGF